jgi:hypothetical protein
LYIKLRVRNQVGILAGKTSRMTVLRPTPWHRRAARAATLLALGLLPARCVSEHQILGPLDGQPDGGSVSSTGTTGSGTTDTNTTGGDMTDGAMSNEAICNDALANGMTGDKCTGSFHCEGPARPCCKTTVDCNKGTLAFNNVCDSCTCTNDNDCLPGNWCVNAFCRSCPILTACPFPLVLLVRNGCGWCTVASQCSTDTSCTPPGSIPNGQVCYAGQPCVPGCDAGSACCSGNICGAPGCGSTAHLDCTLVGCPEGQTCNVLDPRPTCTCFNGQWSCNPPVTRNTCQAF